MRKDAATEICAKTLIAAVRRLIGPKEMHPKTPL